MMKLGRCIGDWDPRDFDNSPPKKKTLQRDSTYPQPICGALRKFLMITEVDARRQGLDVTAGKHPFVLGGARRKTRDVLPICIEKLGGTVPIILIYIYIYMP